MMSALKTIGRVALGGMLVTAGIAHLTFARREFQNLVPEFVPLDPDTTVLASGVAEIAIGTGLLVARRRRRTAGTIAAAFFAAVFPGNLSQWYHDRAAFGLDSDEQRFGRLFFQPLLIWLVLWSTRESR